MDAYRAVPVKFLLSRYGMCWWVRGSLYFLARPEGASKEMKASKQSGKSHNKTKRTTAGR